MPYGETEAPWGKGAEGFAFSTRSSNNTSNDRLERSSMFMSLVLILLLVMCCINLFTRDGVILINVIN